MRRTIPALYGELADWWQTISPTSDYADEAAFFDSLFAKAKVKSILELGAGGGNVAFYLKQHYIMTLTDIAPGMVAMSKKQNPECENVVGDMFSLRLGKLYDAVFIHDAIMYATTMDELRQALETAYVHTKLGGLVVVVPDCIRETFQEVTHYEGHDDGDKAVRYIQWISDPDPADTQFDYDFVIAIKEAGDLRSVVDRQVCGLFSRQQWLEALEQTGFSASAVHDDSATDEEVERLELFIGTKKTRS